MLVYISIGSIFILAVLSLFVLIKTWKNKALLFLIMPFIIMAGSIAGYSVNALHGTAIMGLPEGDDVSVLSISIGKPLIHVVIEDNETKKVKLYAIPYTSDNAKKMARMQAELRKGKSKRGKFKMKNNENSDPNDIIFTPHRGERLPPKDLPSTATYGGIPG